MQASHWNIVNFSIKNFVFSPCNSLIFISKLYVAVAIGMVMTITACIPAAALASFWNKPIITWMATDPDLADKTMYTTLARTMGSLSKMADFLTEVLNYFRWRRVVMVITDRNVWTQAARAMKQASILQVK